MKKPLTFTLTFVLLAVAIGLAVAQKQGEKQPQPSPKPQQKSLTADEAAQLNAKPQKEYPEFTLEAQKVAMQRVEEMRKKTRVEGLREKIPPADWIEIAYHGLVVDANLDPIVMDFDTVSKMQESMFSILYEPARAKALKQYGGDLKTLFYDQKIQGKEQLVVRDAVLSALLDVSDQKLQERYRWRQRLMRGAVDGLIDQRQFVISEAVAALMRQYRFRPEDYRFHPNSQYVDDCQAQGVPIPPNWPDSRWISQGPLVFVFITRSLNAEVFAYKDPAVDGACYALPRRDGAGSINFLGIICQSNTTGKACFWDNISAGVRITGPDIHLNIQTIGNGSNLVETCTDCHRGDNVFNIHPGTALQLSRAGAPGGPYVTDPMVRYTPMGQAHWSNPGPLVMPAPSSGQSSCTSCHQFPQTSGSSYCSAVLQNAAMLTMPPFGPRRGGWPGSSVAVNPSYADHIRRLAGCP